jgi:hypothetical protein
MKSVGIKIPIKVAVNPGAAVATRGLPFLGYVVTISEEPALDSPALALLTHELGHVRHHHPLRRAIHVALFAWVHAAAWSFAIVMLLHSRGLAQLFENTIRRIERGDAPGAHSVAWVLAGLLAGAALLAATCITWLAFSAHREWTHAHEFQADRFAEAHGGMVRTVLERAPEPRATCYPFCDHPTPAARLLSLDNGEMNPDRLRSLFVTGALFGLMPVLAINVLATTLVLVAVSNFTRVLGGVPREIESLTDKLAESSNALKRANASLAIINPELENSTTNYKDAFRKLGLSVDRSPAPEGLVPAMTRELSTGLGSYRRAMGELGLPLDAEAPRDTASIPRARGALDEGTDNFKAALKRLGVPETEEAAIPEESVLGHFATAANNGRVALETVVGKPPSPSTKSKSFSELNQKVTDLHEEVAKALENQVRANESANAHRPMLNCSTLTARDVPELSLADVKLCVAELERIKLTRLVQEASAAPPAASPDPQPPVPHDAGRTDVR